MEGLAASLPLFEARHFLFPFLAHALRTAVGALLAASLASSHKFPLALSVSVVFLMGGVANVFLLPSPVWFAALDLVFAYLPMGWLGGRLAEKL